MKGATMHRLIDLGVDSSRNLRVRIAALRMFIRAVHADRDASFAEHRQKWRRLSRACRSPSRHWSANGWHIGSEPELRRKPWRSAEPGLSETQQ